ncbi:hypothetical protein M427DRAFT_30179 [Gonapodya prolifera JEL478]|uniref:NAD(P)-binding domain-containing protein n=1 Tax=Gonapodya prolifera (strain JEL478) TaxID=1344416 RepID=A0A139ALR7_GONPJ|nr:hypothetical protein M427DRAFT_30179 [Gonapodya prolifera JEL478]|eukprot:KXS17699.1 hypothetical protein M427DRAFT_30179 [Gonapodya prolifera JEL478]
MPHTVFVLGGTGLIGRFILDTFLAKGHTMVAYSGSISSTPRAMTKLLLRYVQSRVVMSSVGPVDGRGHEVGSIAKGYNVLAKAMKETRIQKMYALGTFSYLVPEDAFSFGRTAIVGMVGALSPAAKAEFIEIAKVFNEGNTIEGLDLVVYRFGMLKDFTAGYVGGAEISSGIARSSIAAWLLEQVKQDSKQWAKKLPYIST